MTTWIDLQREAAAKLREGGVEDAGVEARSLVGIAAGVSGVQLIAIETDEAPQAGVRRMAEIVARRIAGEPASRIRGWKDFYGRRFIVTPDVLDPRPETELLVNEAIARLPQGGRVLDLGVGSGCILLSILAERPDASGVGLDLSPAALGVAKRNAEQLGVAARVRLVEGGWEAAPEGPWQVIVSNPPYVTDAEMNELPKEVAGFDPHLALAGGPDGLAPYRIIIPLTMSLLAPGGWLGLEHGWRQGPGVRNLLVQSGFCEISAIEDFAGHSRAAFGRRL